MLPRLRSHPGQNGCGRIRIWRLLFVLFVVRCVCYILFVQYVVLLWCLLFVLFVILYVFVYVLFVSVWCCSFSFSLVVFVDLCCCGWTRRCAMRVPRPSLPHPWRNYIGNGDNLARKTNVQTSGTFKPTADVTSWGEYYEQKTDMSVFHVFL
jgi:hypothetical protein